MVASTQICKPNSFTWHGHHYALNILSLPSPSSSLHPYYIHTLLMLAHSHEAMLHVIEFKFFVILSRNIFIFSISELHLHIDDPTVGRDQKECSQLSQAFLAILAAGDGNLSQMVC